METEEERLSRQNRLELRPYIPESVGIVGCGGIGTYIAISCSMAGVKKIVMFDSDTLELSNLNRLPYPRSWVGRKKTDCINEFITGIVGAFDLNFEAYENVEDECELWPLDGVEFVFITADRGAARKLVTNYCRSKNIPYINVGYDGNDVSFYQRFISSSEGGEPDEGGYTITPSWSAPTMFIAACAMYYMAYPRIKPPFSVNIISLLGSTERYKCDECGFTTVNPWEYDEHIILCTTCRTEFHSREAYISHKVYKCDCGFSSCHKRILDSHLSRNEGHRSVGA